MKRKSLLMMLLVALFVPLAMNAQTRTLNNSFFGSKIEKNVSTNENSSTTFLSKIQPAREAALEELNGRGTRAVGDYELVTSEQIDWSGNYLMAYVASTTSANVFTGKSGNNNYGGYTSATISNNTIASTNTSNYDLTIAPVTYNNNTYYTIKVTNATSNGYLGLTQNGNTLNFATTIPTNNTTKVGYYWNISYDSDNNKLTIFNVRYTSREIQWNSSSPRFCCYQSTQKAISLFKYNDGSCVPPTNFQATDVDLESATLSWTENGSSQYWVVYYMGENDETTSYEIATSTTFTLTGLTPGTTYYAMVVPYCGGLDQESDVIEFTTEDYACPAPTNLYADNVTMNSATLNWTSEAGSYTVQYREAAKESTLFFDDFENGSLEDNGWTTIRNSGGTTSTDWHLFDMSSMTDSNGDPAGIENHSGSYVVIGRSWASSAYSVDNWLITPQVTLDGTLKFWVLDDGQYHETYYVYVSTRGTSIDDFSLLYTPGNASDTWSEVTVDLSSYRGVPGYIAIRLQDRDQDYLSVDDFGIYGEGTPAGPWLPATPNGNSADLTGLDPETTYEWQVMADCGADGESLWASSSFTTLSACGAPIGLSAEALTNSATLSWTGFTDTYNLQYREATDPTAPATIILTTTDIWNDGSGYQMLLDADATAYSDNPDISDYSIFEYLIPSNATYDPNTTGFVLNTSVSIQIPAGTYDWFITNPSPDYNKVYIAASNGNVGGRQDNYVFEAGKTYEFVPSIYGQNDGVDVTITDSGNAWIPVSGPVACPYTLTGLDSETDYEFQVQGVNCDGEGGTSDWSASAFFTTLGGILVESITASDVTVLVGETATITPTVLPADATNPAVSYTSTDPTIASVNENGLVTGVAPGNTTITIAATDGSGVTATINVTVNGIDVTGITASDVTVVNGETATISYTVAPNNASDQTVTFTSANTAIATVDADGVVTGVSVGTTTITIASVSNPEVTATINVTVTSDPNAVQFTVNAPANAQPGDVITVEGVLAAPTSGNYAGFTALILDITYDPTAFEFVTGSIANGPVATQAQQTGAMLTQGTLDNAVQLAIIAWSNNVTTTGVVFSAQFTVLAETGEYTFTAVPHEDNLSYETELLPYEATPSTVEIAVPETYTKHIIGYNSEEGNGTGNYYLIASPIGNVAPTEVTNMTSGSYDLFYFDHSRDLEWVNYKQQTGSSNPGFGLVSGKGYLYANSQTVDLVFTGTAHSTEDVTINLDYTDTADGYTIDMPGWNLVGNPFAVNAYFEDNRGFYTMDPDGKDFLSVDAGDGRHIEAMEGVFVEATAVGQSVTFTTTAPTSRSSRLVLSLSNGRNTIDRAIVRFGEGHQLSKFQLNKNHTKVYIPQDGHDYAIVCSEEMGETPVNFKAENNGTYSLSLSCDNVEFAYLHLIDNLTGADIDLLQTPSYSFEAKTTDYESRFKLVFATGNSNGDTFAFFSNGSFVINNEGNATLQVIDVTGRILKSESINGCTNVNVNATPGVYMLRLINGDNVKVQKVVVK